MAIFGWFMLCVILGFVSSGVFLMAANYGGRWTIGGASNSLASRIGSLIAVIVLVALWMLVFANKPFTITLN